MNSTNIGDLTYGVGYGGRRSKYLLCFAARRGFRCTGIEVTLQLPNESDILTTLEEVANSDIPNYTTIRKRPSSVQRVLKSSYSLIN